MNGNAVRSDRWKKLAALALLAATLGCLFAALDFIVSKPEGVLDFAGFYATGEIVRQGYAQDLYNTTIQQKVESKFLPQGKFFPLDHPPFEAWLCLPLTFLSYRKAYLLWAAFNLLVLGAVFYFLRSTGVSLDADTRLVWLAVCLPLAAGALVLGQDSLLLAPVFLLAFLALKRRRDAIAGLILGVGLFRFEILLPFVFVFFLRRRWKLMAGFSFASLAALFASVILVGWKGLATYGAVLLAAGKATGNAANGINVATMPSLRGALATFSNGAIPAAVIFPLVLIGSLLLLAWAAWEFRDVAEPEHPAYDLQFSFAVIAALLASYHLFVHELTPLIVVAFLLLGYECAARRSRPLLRRPGTLLFLLFFLMTAIGFGLGFRDFSVLFLVLAGLLAWLSWELSSKRGMPAAS